MRRDDWLLAQLPMGMLEDDFFRRFVSIFQDVATTVLEGADNLQNVVDPSVTPTPMLPYMASWLGVRSLDPSLPESLKRRILAESGDILAWRGTRRGLVALLELLCEGEVDVVETGGVWREGEAPRGTGRVEVRVDAPRWASTADFVALVLDELPAHLPAFIFVGGELVWPEVPEVRSA